jgi:uncharacterized membrane protein
MPASTRVILSQVLFSGPPPLDAAFEAAVEEAIANAERDSGAEIVLVVRKQSGSYRDICWLVGAVLAWIVLWLIFFVPGELHPLIIPFELLGVFLLGAWIAGRSFLRRNLISKARRERQVTDHCWVALHEEGICETPASTGILIYWSRLEGRIEAIADLGVVRQLPPEHWNAFTFELHKAEKLGDPRPAILKAIANLGDQLARFLPVPENHVRVLPNRPRGAS